MRNVAATIVSVILILLLLLVVVAAVISKGGPSSSAAPAAPAPSSAPEPSAAPAPSASPSSSAAPAPAPTQAQVTSVAFVGDGYTSGSPAGGQGPANYTALLASQDGWKLVTNSSVYGSGYVAGTTLQAQLPKAITAGPQLVVLTGGRADDQSDPAAVKAAATKLYQDVKTRLPQAKVVVIGPMWLGADPAPRMLPVRDAIRDAATAAQLPYVDPIADKWFNGSDADGIAPGNEILNDKGHQRLAQLVDDALRRSGALPPK